MADKGIIFSAPMVRALLGGRKTQTRRLIKPRRAHSLFDGSWTDSYVLDPGNSTWRADDLFCAAGDRLYVRESYFQFGHWEQVEGKLTNGGRQKWGFIGVPSLVQFDEPKEGYALARSRDNPLVPCWHKRLGRFMPRNLSRMWLAVTNVRVQRLQDITEEDAQAEGVDRLVFDGEAFYAGFPEGTYRCGFAGIWSHLHTAEGEHWDDNPWIVAVSFDVHHGNIDQVQA